MSMSLGSVWAAAPSTERGKPTQLSTSPDGRRLTYASNKSIFVREIDSTEISRQYTDHTANTTVARFSPSGYYVASGDAAGTVKIWDCVGEGATKGSYQICRSINDLGWDGDSQRIIAVGDGKDRFGHCITADSGNSVGEISGQTAQINCVAVRHQRPFRAATGSDDMTTAFFHGAPYKFNTSLRGQHNRFIYGTQFSPDGNALVTVGADKKIWLYDGKTGHAKTQIGIDEHKGSIFSISWAKDSKRFATASADQTVKIWDMEVGKCTESWRLGEEGTVSVPHHQVGVVWPARSDGLLISLSLSGDLNYLTEGTAQPTKIVQAHQRTITAIAPTQEALTFWTGASDGRVYQWSADLGTAMAVEGDQPTNYVAGLSSSGPYQLAAASWDDKLRLIDTGANTYLSSHSSTQGSPRGVAQSGNSTIVATHRGVSVFQQGKLLSHSDTSFTPACLGASEKLIAVGGDDSAVHIFALSGGETLQPIKTLSGLGSMVTSLSLSPSGARLATGLSGGKITVFSTSTWEPEITRWSGHTARITSIAWSRDEGFAASSSLDCSIRVWSVEKPAMRISAMNAHKEGSTGVAWVEEKGTKRRLISTGADAAVKSWDVIL